MQEFFFTILAIWVLWKIFGGGITFRSYTYNASRQEPQQKQESTRINNASAQQEKKPFSDNAGEYVDYEEIKD